MAQFHSFSNDTAFVKHDLKGPLKYQGRISDSFPQNRDRHSLERAINCVLMQSITRETDKFLGKLQSSMMILIYFFLINQTNYRSPTILT